MPSIQPARLTNAPVWPRWVAGLAGVFVALTLIKLGNPVILDHLVEPPRDLSEIVFVSWPLAWGYGLLLVVALASLPVMRFRTNAPRWVVWLPLVWLGWQLVSATQTVDAGLTREALKHFAACVGCFYLGLLALGPSPRTTPFWVGVLAGFAVVLMVGFNQHYGGLAETRTFIYEQIRKGEMTPHPHLLAKMASDRIFSTLVYPNALAGLILLLLPPALAVTWRWCERGPNVLRGVAVGVLAYAGLACLYWSGSKSGWLIALSQGLVLLLQVPLNRIVRLVVIAAVLAGGLTVFFLRFEAYFQKGATSIGARFDYWRAAGESVKAHPLTGSGPGTFYTVYRKLKRPEAEMTRLTHNDYLQQASDSGLPGSLAYLALVLGSIGVLYRNIIVAKGDGLLFVWLGLFGWALQGFVEFGLYIPALGWVAFLLLGWLWGATTATKEALASTPATGGIEHP